MGSELKRNELARVFARNIVPFVQSLLEEGKEGLGVLMGHPEIKEHNTSSTKQNKIGHCDRFKLEIPYAGQTLIWEVLFDSHQTGYPPDFIFRADDDNFCPDIRKISALEHWNQKDPKNLVKLLRQLLNEYKEHQILLIQSHARLSLEYSYILKQEEYGPNSVEVHMSQKSGNRCGPVNFLIKLPIKFGKLPVPLLDYHPEEDQALLLVNYSSPDTSKIIPSLYLSNRLENVLGGTSKLRLPAYHAQGGLIEFIPNICQLLEKKIDQVCDNFEKKKEYIAAFHAHFGRSVLEYDQVTFSKISLLQEWNDFFFMVHIEIPPTFPVDKPDMVFQSVYHENGGEPFKLVICDYPYSPRWSGNEMAERARAFFLDHVSTFQKASLTSGTIS